ncbi:glycoside hydrolase family 36 protein [Aliiglaciecola sp. LCG003]|uniref:glycoside hydrolase family 36 protein n=1 Tax=Aliiglaciecola sp. LCG003 TaxID=3053655 RepID=UPI0025748310|nr:glycoside hydrolase family 36 protein [Aliiglaciecola sp. LCG003]WJG09603.1 alpha-galactosidase [Aliiglaciecola sp. LCG003]
MLSTLSTRLTSLLISLIILTACQNQTTSSEVVYEIKHKGITLEFNSQLYSRVVATMDGQHQVLGDYQPSEYIADKSAGFITDFEFIDAQQQQVQTEIGEGQQTIITGRAANGLLKRVQIQAYAEFPNSLFIQVSYKNEGQQNVIVTKWVQNAYQLLANKNEVADADNVDFWSYQGASFEDRRDWVMPLTPGYEQQNYMGMNASDYGSGTAIADIWRKDIGLAIGHIDINPKLVSFPVSYPANVGSAPKGAKLHIELEKTVKLMPGEDMQTLDTFVSVHQKDYYHTLKTYRQVMAKKGLKMAEVPDSAYEPIWCAWGYERDFSFEEILQTLPKAKQLGLEWAVLDDGWQTAEGDWYLNPDKFPNGDEDMKAFVKDINNAGLKAKLWWAPLAVDPGTDMIKQHPEMLLLNEDGSTRDITWWDSYYLCPADENVRQHSVDLVKKILGEWGYDGLKIDGQHLNGVPPCYNPAHNHATPEASVEALAEYWKLIYDTAMEINPEAVVEICPCGDSYAFHNLPYMNQAVSSDPLTSWQVRLKGKTLKGLMGESAPYYGDHVELSDNASDFASSFGIGAVLGTKFTLPSDNEVAKQFLLDPEKEKVWQLWFDLYNRKMLPKGTYLGELYDIGFDKPETHVVAKDGKLYFAFYADNFAGSVELRGLTAKQYKVVDYVHGKDLGTVDMTNGVSRLTTQFEQFLLIELTPVE